MFQWLMTRLSKWPERILQREIERLLEEHRAMKAQIRELDGVKPIRLSPEDKKRLAAKRQGNDPEWLRAIDALELEDAD